MEITVQVVENTGVPVGSTGVDIDTPGVQDTSHEDNNNEDEDDDMIIVSDKYIPEQDVCHPYITSPT